MMSASSSLPEVSRRPLLGEAVDPVGDHRCRTGGDGLEEVAVRDGAEALVPRVVAGREVRGDVVTGRQLALQALGQHPSDQLRVLPAHPVEDLGEDGMEPFRGCPGLFRRQEPLRSIATTGLFSGKEATYVGERCSMVTWEADRARAGTSVNGSGATADDHDRLPGEVEPLRPGLWMHDGAGEVVHTFEIGQIPVVVAVVAAAGEEEGRRELDASRWCRCAPP